jgi:outer membrane murein-binding lipoprotein Lpp
MLKKKMALAAAVVGTAGLLLALPSLTTAVNKPATKVANDGRAKCYECHDEIKALKEGSKHAKLACTVCHDKLDAHMKDPEKNKPVTLIDQQLCGKCHKN